MARRDLLWSDRRLALAAHVHNMGERLPLTQKHYPTAAARSGSSRLMRGARPADRIPGSPPKTNPSPMGSAPARPQFNAQMSGARGEAARDHTDALPVHDDLGQPPLTDLAGGAAFVVDLSLRCLVAE